MNRNILILMMLWMGAALVTVPEDAHCVQASVILAKEVLVDDPRVLLGSVARVDTSDPELGKKLSSVLVGFAPLPGTSRRLVQQEVVQALSVAGFPPGVVTVGGSHETRLVRPFQLISERRLSRVLLESVSKRMGLSADEVGFAKLRFSDEAKLGRGDVEVRVVYPEEPRFDATFVVKVLLLVDGLPSKQLDVEAMVVRGRTDALQGRSPVRSARSRERMVRRGDPVSLEVVGPGIYVTVSGKARSNGYLGDEVKVENVISGVIVRGIVEGPRKVRVPWN